jgi:ParB-like chromosome segregation protein Spo0J
MGSRSHFEQLPPSTLRPFTLNKTVFGEMDADLNPDFIESIRTEGILTPCIVTTKHLILSGHRRIAAAIKVGLKLIPCMIVDEQNPDRWQAIWADANRNREMSVEQRARYYQCLKDIAIKQGKRGPHAKEESEFALKSAQTPESRPDGQIRKDSRQEAAEQAGFNSHYKAETVAKVVETIDKLEETGKPEAAAELRTVLETKPAAAALRAAVEVLPPEPKPRPAKPVEADTTPDEDEDRSWKKSDATKFRAAFQTIIRTIDRGAELDQLTVGEHAAFLSTFKKFGNDWQKLFSEQEWL